MTVFNDLTSSDKNERDRITFKRLCILRMAYRAGYFNEPVVEQLKLPCPDDVAPADEHDYGDDNDLYAAWCDVAGCDERAVGRSASGWALCVEHWDGPTG